MAKITIDEEHVVSPVSPIDEIQDPIVPSEVSDILEDVQVDDERPLSPSDNIQGLTEEETKDPNKISVTIADKDAPIVVLFGPPACGKTMTLVRLTRFLRENGYSITPVRTFRPTYDTNYSSICENFDVMMNQDDAAQSTSKISFMLVKVSKNGKTICQMLEAPGEYYFNPKAPNRPFPRYFNAIVSSRNRKIWAIMVEPDWKNESDRLNYVDRIKKLRTKMSTRDKTIFVYNKIDMTEYKIDNSGNVHVGSARKNINDLYPKIFEPFRNTTPIVSLFSPYRCDFTVFQTGDYSVAEDGTNLFEQGPDVFPRRLWSKILGIVRG